MSIRADLIRGYGTIAQLLPQVGNIVMPSIRLLPVAIVVARSVTKWPTLLHGSASRLVGSMAEFERKSAIYSVID